MVVRIVRCTVYLGGLRGPYSDGGTRPLVDTLEAIMGRIIPHHVIVPAGRIIPHFSLVVDSGQIAPYGGPGTAGPGTAAGEAVTSDAADQPNGTLEAAEVSRSLGQREETWTVVWVEDEAEAEAVRSALQQDGADVDVSCWVGPATGDTDGPVAQTEGRIIPH
jgi:hypothetical protein